MKDFKNWRKYFKKLTKNEDEDEKIRKNMFNFFKYEYGTNSNACFAGIKVKDIIAWFEKQSKKEYALKSFYDEDVRKFIQYIEKRGKETSWKPSKEEMDVLYSLAYITNKYDEHKEEVITRLYQDLKREFFNGSSCENMFPNTEDGIRLISTIQVLEYARSLDNYNQYGKADIDKNIAWLKKKYTNMKVKTYAEF